MGLKQKAPGEATYLPDESDKVQLAKVYDFLAAHEQAGRGGITPRYFLSGIVAGDRVELPRHAYEVLRQVVEAMQQGLPVTVAPRSHVLTTQQAADLLQVSRPTVIKLGSPADQVGRTGLVWPRLSLARAIRLPVLANP